MRTNFGIKTGEQGKRWAFSQTWSMVGMDMGAGDWAISWCEDGGDGDDEGL